MTTMFRSRLLVTTLVCTLLVPGDLLLAQDSTSSSTSSSKKKTSSSSSSTHKSTSTKKSASTHSHSRKKVTTARAHQMHRSFVASTDLRPMARQLVEFRTPAAYTGVENYAHTHAGTEAAALAWFAIGYAHYLDAQYPAAITALQKAQPQIGELKDYVAFFIGNSYVLSNNSEESHRLPARLRYAFPGLALRSRRNHCLCQSAAGVESSGRRDQVAGGASRTRPRRNRILSGQSLCAERARPQRC